MIITHRWARLVVVVAVLSSLIAVVSPRAFAEPGDPNSISGSVTRPSGDPARGILVTGELAGGGDSFAVVTNSDGAYSAVGLTPGDWIIRLEDLDNRTLATEWHDGAVSEAGADAVTLTPGAGLTGVNASLVTGAAVNGTVLDTTGRPVPATVSLYAADGTTLVETMTAGRDGIFRFRGLHAGTFHLEAVDGVFGVGQWLGGGVAPGTAVTLAVGQISGGRNLVLSGGRITGAVTTSGATPAPGVPVSFDGVATVYSATDGTYTSPFLAPDTYTVDFGPFASTPGVVVSAATVAGINGAIGAGAPAITGTVTAAGVTLHGVAVEVSAGAYTSVVETRANGSYTAYVPAGAVTVDFSSPHYQNGTGIAAVSPGVVDRVLVANAAVSGPPAGTAVTTTGVAINGLPRISGFSGPTIEHTSCAGGFGEITLFDGITAWTQQMDEIGAPGTYVAKIPLVTNIGLYGETRVTITTECGGTPSVTAFSVYIDPTGRVFDTNGDPVFGATVTLHRDDPSTNVVDFAVIPSGSGLMDPRIGTANPLMTDGAGFFRWDLAPSTYRVQVTKAGCHAVGNPAAPTVTSPAFTTPRLNFRVTMQCVALPPPTTPADNPEIAPGGECPSPGALDPFTDVSPTSFARRDITCIFQLHVTTGTSPTTYSPADLVTREQMASFLARLYAALTGGLAPTVATPFLDMDTAAEFAKKDIGRIYGLGVTTGTSPTTYSPKDFVTREQMASFLARLFHSVTAAAAPPVPTPFLDMDTAAEFAKKDIGRIYGLGVTTGTSPTTYSPKDFVTREQMASFLARLFRTAGGSEA